MLDNKIKRLYQRTKIGRLFGADNRPADNRPKHYLCTSTLNRRLSNYVIGNKPPSSTTSICPCITRDIRQVKFIKLRVEQIGRNSNANSARCQYNY